ncbi:uncharacterized protein LOC131938099 [Physella acuta]|uniref:uncharacterized protein LOC131938099 n=1 Tax=Physella acuta TaxID=109671 RepID=UPI0027DE1E7F|nr:uncharacterized protein LOC131938099 [Physella acuta]
MKISHSDQVTSHSFQWSCVSYEKKQKPHSEDGPSSDKKTKTVATSVPRNRFHHASCMHGRYLYMYGGKDRYSPLKDFWRLDTVYQTWEEIEETKSKLPHLQGHTMVSYKSQLLIFGGTFHDSLEEIPLWIYNPDLAVLRKWYDPSAAQPSGRREHSAVVYKNTMFIYGGFLDHSGSTDEFWAFDIDEEEWVNVHHRKPGKRHGHVAVVFSNSMWLHGGMRELTALSDLWTYHFSLCKWSKVKGLGLCPTLSNHTAHVTDNTLLLVGGSRLGAVVHDIWAFNFETESWKQLTFDHCDTYPCVSLHTSVVLRPSAVQDTKDRSQSVPQLKSKGVVREEMTRPMTSPPQLNFQDKKFEATSNAGDYQMDALDRSCPTNLDQVLNIEAETSFSCCDANEKDRNCTGLFKAANVLNVEESRHHSERLGKIAPACRHQSESSGKIAPACRHQSESSGKITPACRHQSESSGKITPACRHQSESSGKITPACRHQSESSGKIAPACRHQSESSGKITPACVEHSRDNIPLLQRFHSVLSDVEWGENNLSLTISDENIDGREEKLSSVKCLDHSTPGNTGFDADNRWATLTQKHFQNISGQANFDKKEYDVVFVEDLTVESKFDDLNIEDLELCDVDQLFIQQTPVHHSPPQSRLLPGLDSCSMENIGQLAQHSTQVYSSHHTPHHTVHSSHHVPHPTQVYSSHHTPHHTVHSSCHKPLPTQMNHATKQACSPSSNSSAPEKETINAFSAELGLDVSSPSDQDLAASKHHSIGTQTQDFLVTDTQELHHGFTSPLARCNTSTLPFSHSIMGDSELCLLVLGGQTEDPTFKTEPLKLWKCHIY